MREKTVRRILITVGLAYMGWSSLALVSTMVKVSHISAEVAIIKNFVLNGQSGNHASAR